ncbi:MAG: hypothetical protein ACQEVA_21940 [Myxococcota bacterium]
MASRISLASFFFLGVMLVALGAGAHGSEPLPEKLYGFDSGDWVFQTNFGVITSETSTRYVCEEAFNGGDDFRVAALGLNRWVIFTPDAIYRTEDGCEFEKVEPLPKIPSDMAAVRGGAGVAYVINSDEPEHAGVFVSDDAGASFRQVGVDVGSRQFTRVEFLDAGTLLVSAYSRDSASQGAAELIEVGIDGDTMTMLEVPDGLKYPYLLDVEADSVLWQASTEDGQSLFWGSVDEPGRDEFPLDAWPKGAVLSADGSEFWVAAANEGSKGLTHATAPDMMVDIAADHSGLCIGRAADTVYACARGDREGHELSRVAGSQIEAAVDFSQLEGPRNTCPEGSDVATTCPAVWPELAVGLGIEVDEDPDEDTDKGGVCAAVGTRGPVGVHLFILALLAGALLRARRR